MPHEFEKQMQLFLSTIQMVGCEDEKIKTIKRELVAMVQSPHQALQLLYHFPDQFVNLIPTIFLEGYQPVRQAVVLLTISHVKYDIGAVVKKLIPIAQHFSDLVLWTEICHLITNRIPDNDEESTKLLEIVRIGINSRKGFNAVA